jgi:hypothetical protein
VGRIHLSPVLKPPKNIEILCNVPCYLLVQQSLVTSIKRSFHNAELNKLAIGFQRWLEDKNAGVEIVGPPWKHKVIYNIPISILTNVWGGRNLRTVEQLIDVLQDQSVGVQEYGLLILGQTPCMQFCEGKSKIRTANQCQILLIIAVQNVDQ